MLLKIFSNASAGSGERPAPPQLRTASRRSKSSALNEKRPKMQRITEKCQDSYFSKAFNLYMIQIYIYIEIDSIYCYCVIIFSDITEISSLAAGRAPSPAGAEPGQAGGAPGGSGEEVLGRAAERASSEELEKIAFLALQALGERDFAGDLGRRKESCSISGSRAGLQWGRWDYNIYIFVSEM